MKRTKKRSFKFGLEAVAITALTVASVVILNIVFTSLAYRFGFFTNMSSDLQYAISDDCIDYLKDEVFTKTNEKIKIIFCDDEDVIVNNQMQSYVYNSSLELKEEFPNNIEIEFLNIWEQPRRAKKLGVTSSYDVCISYKDNFYVLAQSSMFVSDADTQSVLAYHGEKRIAAAMMRVTSSDLPVCYITVNHGESMDSYELLYTLADAGYSCTYLDLLNFDIPDDCKLLVTIDPKQDITNNSTDKKLSESDKIRNYIDGGGDYLVFVSPDTFANGGYANFESLMADFGVDFCHFKGEENIENVYQIRDTSHSVSIDGYTVFSEISSANAANALKDTKSSIFASTTAIKADERYEKNSDGSYSYSKDGREMTFSPLLMSYNSAEAFAGGKVVDKATDEPFIFMSETEQKYNGNTSKIIVCASTSFVNKEYMQSTVYGNSDVISIISEDLSGMNTPSKLKAKPFPTTKMESITTKNATIITVSISVTFALAAIISGMIVLIKRKNAL